MNMTRRIALAVTLMIHGSVTPWVRFPTTYDKEKLVADVLKAVSEYPTEQLERMWEYKEYVMEAVEKCNGGNDYPRHRRDAA